MASPKSVPRPEDEVYTSHIAMMNPASVEKRHMSDTEADKNRFRIDQRKGVVEGITMVRPLGGNDYLVIKIPGELSRKLLADAQSYPEAQRQGVISEYLSGAGDRAYDQFMERKGKSSRFEIALSEPQAQYVPKPFRSLIIGRRDIPWESATVPVPIEPKEEQPVQEAPPAQAQTTTPKPPARTGKAEPPKTKTAPEPPAGQETPAPPQFQPAPEPAKKSTQGPVNTGLPPGVSSANTITIVEGNPSTYVLKDGDGSVQKPYQLHLGPHKGAKNTPGGREATMLMEFFGVYVTVHATASQLTKKNREEGGTQSTEMQLQMSVRDTLSYHYTSQHIRQTGRLSLKDVADNLEGAIFAASDADPALKRYLGQQDKGYKSQKKE